ncbi:MAG TPA: M48 family metalloprotease [Terriglobia bacterium]|nr:M48 family metalloprotease [Terriglobia bacterium]
MILSIPTRNTTASSFPRTPSNLVELGNELQKSYLTLFNISPSLHFSANQINQMRDLLNNQRNQCTGAMKKRANDYKSQINQEEAHLKQVSATISDTARHSIHCRIQNLRYEQAQASVLAEHAIPIAYANEQAKLDLIQHWPSDLQSIQQEIESGAYRNRRWGDVQDIGKRTIEPGQQDDIKMGEQAVKQFEASGLEPPVIKDPEIVNYVNKVAQQVALHSDLKVTLHLTVLDTKEINAFSFPGGFVFVNRGLLDAVDDSSELAGVIGHEIGHVVCRHAHREMQHEEIAGIFMQGAAVAASILIPGASTIGGYLAEQYAFQYGFFGAEALLNLALLGVSRQYELQADQLGIQYAWNAGYDPSGFIRFFDKLATKVGYVQGIGWFYDHPPFYTRMLDAEREIMFLPKKSDLTVTSSDFENMKRELAQYEAKTAKKSAILPYERVQGCAKPQKLGYDRKQPIQSLCSSLDHGQSAGTGDD